MPGKVNLIGPGMYVFFGLFVLIAVFGVWMMIDTTRPKRRLNKKLNHIPHEPLSAYVLCGGLYMALFLLMLVLIAASGKQSPVAMAVLFVAPFMAVIEVAYLLRVVYPKPVKEQAGKKPGKKQQADREDEPGEDDFLGQIGKKDKS